MVVIVPQTTPLKSSFSSECTCVTEFWHLMIISGAKGTRGGGGALLAVNPVVVWFVWVFFFPELFCQMLNDEVICFVMRKKFSH